MLHAGQSAAQDDRVPGIVLLPYVSVYNVKY